MEKVRSFFIKYHDRLLYATDLADNGKIAPVDLQNRMHDTWIRDWQFFASDDVKTSDLITGEFKGLKLPRKVIDKLYAKNVKKWLKMFSDNKE